MKNIKFVTLSLIITFLSIPILIAGKENVTNKNEFTFDAAEIENNSRLINLIYDSSRKIITLDNTELIEDDVPGFGVPKKYFGVEYRQATAPWQEDLKKGIKIKKILMVQNPKAFSGRLLFFGMEKQENTEPLHISINGCEIIRPATKLAYPFAKQYTDIVWLRWYFVDLPIGTLNEGANEVILWTESVEPTWKICISSNEEYKHGSLTRTSHPNRSLKSLDGGKTWKDSKLGINNSEDGEYNIRFSLDRYVPYGEYISPVLDITGSTDLIKKDISNLKSEILVDMKIPEGTNAKLMIRFNSSPILSDKSWIEIKANKKLSKLLNTKRYFQWKVKMTTANPLKSPEINGIRIKSEWENKSPNKKLGIVAKVKNNGKVIIPSYKFTYENLDHPDLLKFRKKFKLDKIVKGADSEFEKMMRLLHWAYRIPVKISPYSWNGNDIAVYKKSPKRKDGLVKKYGGFDIWDWIELATTENDMPELQWDYKERRRDAMCNFSNLALQTALMSMGYQARYININSEAVSGHEVTEVWSNEFNKWIYMDATRDYYYYDLDTGLPMNLLEVHNKLVEILPYKETWQRPFAVAPESEDVHKIKIGIREGINKFSIDEDGHFLIKRMGYFRIMLRNDFYSHPYPIPTAQGYTMWGWNGYLNYYDNKFPKRTEFQRQSNRFVDFYEPLNQAEVYLSETDQKGILKIEVYTHTPGLKSFLVKINNKNWVEKNTFLWNWKLKAGMNKIEVRTKTLQNILGPVSIINVTFNP